MEAAAGAVSHEILDYGKAFGLDIRLDGVPDIADTRARLHDFDGASLCFERSGQKRHGGRAHGADGDRRGIVAVESIQDERDVDADDVTFLQHVLLIRDAVANHFVDRGADALREAAIVEGRRDHVMAFREVDLQVVDVLRRHPGPDLFDDPLETLGGETARGRHRLQLRLALDEDFTA